MEEFPIPVIAYSVIEQFRSRGKESDVARAIATVQHGFGGHPCGKEEYIAQEGKTSRIHQI